MKVPVIKLPLISTFGVSLDLKEPKPADLVEMPNGEFVLPLGPVVDAEMIQNMQIVRANGSTIIYATLAVEKTMNQILDAYFMGGGTEVSKRRAIFQEQFLESSFLSFSSRKQIISNIVNEEELLKGKTKNKFQSLLKKIMDARNAFAHGDIKHYVKRGFFIEFHSGGKKSINLDGEYWSAIEECFTGCDEILKVLLASVSKLD